LTAIEVANRIKRHLETAKSKGIEINGFIKKKYDNVLTGYFSKDLNDQLNTIKDMTIPCKEALEEALKELKPLEKEHNSIVHEQFKMLYEAARGIDVRYEGLSEPKKNIEWLFSHIEPELVNALRSLKTLNDYIEDYITSLPKEGSGKNASSNSRIRMPKLWIKSPTSKEKEAFNNIKKFLSPVNDDQRDIRPFSLFVHDIDQILKTINYYDSQSF